MTSALIVAAGSSRRMGFDKLFADLGGKPVLAHSIATFLDHPEIDEVLVVTSPANHDAIAAIAPSVRLVAGGAERYLSVWNGLQAVHPSSQWIAVHDGARPLIHPGAITACLEAARRHGAAACAHPITETVKRVGPDGRVCESVDRENLWAMETPQCFRAQLLLDAYRHILRSDRMVTDEVSAVEALGEAVYLVNNSCPNPKITFPADLQQAARLLESPS